MSMFPKENAEEPRKILMSVYSINDSAYLDLNNEFIASLTQIQPGMSVATLAENSRRTLECLPPREVDRPGIENICIDGKLAITLRPRSVYDELAKSLIMIHSYFIDSPDADNIIILVDEDAVFDKIISVMDRARAAGFSKINLAKFDEEELRKLEEKQRKDSERAWKRLLRGDTPSRIHQEKPQSSLRVRSTSGLKVEVQKYGK